MPATRRTVASAPGKLILIGEHAVVYGRAALVTAIDLRLQVTMEPGDGGVLLCLPCLPRVCHLSWPQVVEETRRAKEEWESRFVTRVEAPSRSPEFSPERLAVLALGEAALRWGEAPLQGVTVTVESDLPVGAGFGSSAALAAAVAGAWLAWQGKPDQLRALAEICLEVERRQHGTPSGIDHTAVLQGGLLESRKGPEGTLVSRHLGASALLGRLQVFDSGRPAQTTGEVVSAVRQQVEAGEETSARALEEIDRATQALRYELLAEREDSGTVVAAIRASQRALETLGVVPEPVQATIREVERAGGAAKISGAGALTGTGAGSILIYQPTPSDDGCLKLPRSWRPLKLSLAAPGLRVSSTVLGSTELREIREEDR